ncbi:hypothetical protein [Butyrivibrio sp. FCS014]|uniref:hypothetical protein n=1 Tax=Butyrivibrio sp. FCS014 TaxID=1408304 RepID=UPI000467BD27|nr:hypothetical protein [Butyrivibrio sp. FCS014]
MGLFSKKTFVCEKCGREFEARMHSTLCDDCKKKAESLKEDINGYLLSAIITGRKIDKSQYEEVVNHRNGILEKYRNTLPSITIEELQQAADNYMNLSSDQAKDIIERAKKSLIRRTAGALYNSDFLVPLSEEKIVVDMEDVFAVAYTSDPYNSGGNSESILIVFFTNDPYIPTVPMLIQGKIDEIKFLSAKSNSSREYIKTFIEGLCPNLQYAVQDLKDFKKLLKSEKSVKGNIEYKEMMNLVDLALVLSGTFDTKKMPTDASDATIELINKYGYITGHKVIEILKLYDKKPDKYWSNIEPQIWELFNS